MAKRAPESKAARPNDLIAKPPGAPSVIPDADPIAAAVIAETPMRKTVAPKPAAVTKPASPAATYEQIAERAYYISRSSDCRSEFDNWLRAEGELKGDSV